MIGPRSRRMLQGVHPDLVRVIEEADRLGVVEFAVLEGLRTMERQVELMKAGASRTLRSRHLGPVAHAVDLGVLVNGKVRWDWPLYDKLATVVKAAASNLMIPLEWGGDWESFKDGPHYQLPWKSYPGNPASG